MTDPIDVHPCERTVMLNSSHILTCHHQHWHDGPHEVWVETITGDLVMLQWTMTYPTIEELRRSEQDDQRR